MLLSHKKGNTFQNVKLYTGGDELNYYRLTQMYQYEEDTIVVNDYDLTGFDLRRFWKGQRIDSWDQSSIRLISSNQEIALDCLPNILSWLILSNKAVSTFEKTGINNIQVFPVNIAFGKQGYELNYNIVNILTRISALDRNRSDFVCWDDGSEDIKFIRKVVLDKTKLPDDIHIFFLKEGTGYIVVSDVLKNALLEQDMTGFEFTSLED